MILLYTITRHFIELFLEYSDLTLDYIPEALITSTIQVLILEDLHCECL